MKKAVFTIAITFIAIIAIVILSTSIRYNRLNEETHIVQMGKVVNTETKQGIYFTIPIVQTTKTVYMGERLYDLPKSDVITADKRSMTADCYAIYRVVDPLAFYRQLSTFSATEGRLNVAVYNSMKNTISSMDQISVIQGKDGSLSRLIRENAKMSQYGIEIVTVEMKALDLPENNKNDIYNRMKSERQTIASAEEAKGEQDYIAAISRTDAEVTRIVSNAERLAANIRADGESKYYSILATAYSQNPDRLGFYNYLIDLDATRESLKNGGVMVLTPDSPLYSVLMNRNSDWDSSGQESYSEYVLEIPEDLLETFGEDLRTLGIIEN